MCVGVYIRLYVYMFARPYSKLEASISVNPAANERNM